MTAPEATLHDHLRDSYPMESWSVVLLACLAGAAHAGCLALVALAVYAAPRGTMDQTHLLWLGALAPLALALKIIAFRASVDLGEQAAVDFRVDLARRVSFAELETVERIGPTRLREAFDAEMDAISGAVWSMGASLQAWALIVAAMGLALFFAFDAALMVIIMQLAAYVAFARFAETMRRRTRIAQRRDDHLAARAQTLFDRAKALRVDRRGAIAWWRGAMLPAIRRCDRAYAMREDGEAFSHAWYLTINALIAGVVAFTLPHYASVAGAYFLLTVIFGLFERFGHVAQARPFIHSGDIALESVRGLLTALPEAALDAPDAPGDFREIRCEGVSYGRLETDFAVGPVSLTLERGRVHFLSGPDGAGRTAILKLLCGLLPADQGQVLVDGVEIPVAARRSIFAAVFTDFHLFDAPGILPEDAEADIAHWLTRLNLDGVVECRDGRFTTLALSTGQRKRLALAVALAERRPVLALDEWTADQDPVSRRLFYTEWLPEIRARGVTVIAAVQDEQFFEHCDVLMRVEAGRITGRREMPGGGA